jgi:hypothetical protein
MAGNKKPARKVRKVKPGSDAFVVDLLQRGKSARRQRYLQRKHGVDKRNNLPLGHQLNQHKIEKTFGPLERVLQEQETTGTNLVDDDGDAVMHDPDDGWIKIVPGLLHMIFVFEHIARARVWPKMPEGLRVYALGLQIGRKLDQDDINGARETIAWMRKHIATLSPIQWTELFEWAVELGEKDEKEANEQKNT